MGNPGKTLKKKQWTATHERRCCSLTDVLLLLLLLLLTDELLYDAERHDDERDAEVGDRQRDEEIVGDALKFAFDSHRHTDEHVTGYSGRDERQQ